ncbi:MAG: ATP-dependent DNA helicase RecG [Nitrospirota bacterium]
MIIAPHPDKAFPWDTPIQYFKKVGPKRSFLFGKLNVETLEDLLYFLPFRYEDRTTIKKIKNLTTTDEIATVLGEVIEVTLIQTARRSMKIVEITLADDTGVISAKWFNQPYLATSLKKGDRLMLSGKIRSFLFRGSRLEIESPQYEMIDENEPQIHLGRIVPIYHETKGLTSRQIRLIVWLILEEYKTAIPEIIPSTLIEKYKLISLSDAILECHFPSKDTSLSQLHSGKTMAHQRLAFNELFLLETGLALRKQKMTAKEAGISFQTNGALVKKMRRLLPFELTPAQESVISEIKNDMASASPMYRLLQGDVGSGKTVVALMAILIAIENGYQAAFMVPTEILAQQHFLSLSDYFKTLGCRLLLFTSGMKKKEKEEGIKKMESGEVDLVIGTHALIQDAISFAKLGLAVIDEQHKFGVLQRAKIIQKGWRPDILMMTATPIPRTLALTLYGDLHFSAIHTLPPGRTPIITRVFNGKNRDQVYQLMEKAFLAGRQAYVVCPLVETSEKIDIKAATELAKTLQDTIFQRYRVGLLHGRMKQSEKQQVMRAFKEGQTHLLVATTVIEVGIDVPNATVMVVEHAERFGLSQMHQIRGRVGRGGKQSYCFLIGEYPQSEDAKARLAVMQNTNDGFKIAEEDLVIRGPGEFFGTKQSGLPELKVANLLRDGILLETARKEAFLWIENDVNLSLTESHSLRAALERKWKGKLELLAEG